MESNFFNDAKKKEKSRRHLNLLMHFYFSVNNSPLLGIINIRNSKGQQQAFHAMEDCLSSNNLNYFFRYLKDRYNIDDETYKDVLGLKELTPTLKTPNDCTQEEHLILIIHLILVTTYNSSSDNMQMDFFANLTRALNYNAERVNFISDTVNKYLPTHTSLNDIIILENIVKKAFIKKFGTFPPMNHA